VARALERLHAGDPGPVAAQVAAHHERAGEAAEAVAWYQRAAAAAQRLPAYAEAVRLLERALRLLRAQPPTPARRERELAVLTRLQGPLAVVDGYAWQRLAEVQRRGLELANELGVEPVAPLLRSTATATLARATSRARGGWVSGCGPAGRPPTTCGRSRASTSWGSSRSGRGVEAARRHLEAALDRYRPGRRSAELDRYGGTTEVLATIRLGNTLGFLGRPEAATRARAAALARAEETGHPHSREAALLFGAMLALELRDPASVRTYAAGLAALPGDLSRPTRVGGDALAGYVEVLDGREAAGITRIRHGLQDPTEDEHAPGMHAMVARVLLEACVVAGDARTGLVAAERALGLDDNVRTWESEARRRRGEFLAALGAPWDEAEAELRRALGVARRQGARLLELRAAVSLLRHRQDAGDDPSRARDRLRAVVDAVPEGRDTPDLRDAVALLSRT
jgi:tetratricopeptide (TPR) repeat protein